VERHAFRKPPWHCKRTGVGRIAAGRRTGGLHENGYAAIGRYPQNGRPLFQKRHCPRVAAKLYKCARGARFVCAVSAARNTYRHRTNKYRYDGDYNKNLDKRKCMAPPFIPGEH
jgi:hypothetical protein